MIQKIITQNRKEHGSIDIIFKNIGNMMKKIHLQFLKNENPQNKKDRPYYYAYKFLNSICENIKVVINTIIIQIFISTINRICSDMGMNNFKMLFDN